jgi:hypothetical protein
MMLTVRDIRSIPPPPRLPDKAGTAKSPTL